MTHPENPLTEPGAPRLRLSASALVAIALGGALGTVARFLLDSTFVESSHQFPTVTLLINLSGSFAIGLLIPVVERLTARVPLGRPFLILGVLGGWTTYSALAVSAITLLQNGDVITSVLYLAATVGGGTALVLLGNECGRGLARI